MVNLGFINNSSQCPAHAHHVRILPSDFAQNKPGESTVRIWYDQQGRARWDLDWQVSQPSSPRLWCPLLAAKLHDLNWTAWWLDVALLEQTMQLSAPEALHQWGEVFWPSYQLDALIFLDVDAQRRGIYQIVRQWQNRFPRIRFSPQHDFDRET